MQSLMETLCNKKQTLETHLVLIKSGLEILVLKGRDLSEIFLLKSITFFLHLAEILWKWKINNFFYHLWKLIKELRQYWTVLLDCVEDCSCEPSQLSVAAMILGDLLAQQQQHLFHFFIVFNRTQISNVASCQGSSYDLE